MNYKFHIENWLFPIVEDPNFVLVHLSMFFELAQMSVVRRGANLIVDD